MNIGFKIILSKVFNNIVYIVVLVVFLFVIILVIVILNILKIDDMI